VLADDILRQKVVDLDYQESLATVLSTRVGERAGCQCAPATARQPIASQLSAMRTTLWAACLKPCVITSIASRIGAHFRTGRVYASLAEQPMKLAAWPTVTCSLNSGRDRTADRFL